MASINRSFELLPLFRERVWGRKSLLPFFSKLPGNNCIGEVWFTHEENQTSFGENFGALLKSNSEVLGNAGDSGHPGICPILVKLLFTSERLSIQVHPDDAYAQAHHGSLGKTEAWYILDSQDPGELAVGFRQPLASEKLEEVALSGEIVELLDWRKVNRGDVVFTPAGTVHAIGAGLAVCEIQQNSDITYRLYDYGRPRELHLEHGAKVSYLGPHEHDPHQIELSPGRTELVACSYFRIERVRPSKTFEVAPDLPFYVLAICVAGSGSLDGSPVGMGRSWFIPAGGDGASFEAPGSEWILTYASETATPGISVM